MAINWEDGPPELFSAYLEALVAYRMAMRQTLKLLLAAYGDTAVKQHFKATSLANLLDAHDPRFLSHRQAATFISSRKSAQGNQIVEQMYKNLKSDPALHAFSDLLRGAGNRAIADDLPFYIEHRLRLARNLANVKVVAAAKDVVALHA